MTLKEQVEQELSRLEGQAAFATGPQIVVLQHEGRELRCELAALDRLGCAVNHLSVAGPRLAGATLEQLRAIGESLASRLVYLLESIAIIEIDAGDQAVQLRSQPPHREQRSSSYYELVIGRGRLELRRYTKEQGTPRRGVPANLTREVLLRLAGDLVAAA